MNENNQNSSKITWNELYQRVKDCKDIETFARFSDIDLCINDAQLLLKHTPDEFQYHFLREALELTSTRLTSLKGIKKREQIDDYSQVSEKDFLQERLIYRINKKMELETWNDYEMTLTKEVKAESVPPEKQEPQGIAFYQITIILVLFFIIYGFNLILSGRFSKKKLIYKLTTLELVGYADLIKKEIELEEVYDKKRAKKKGYYEELTAQERSFLERIYQMKDKIDESYDLLLKTYQIPEENTEELEEIENKITENLEVIIKAVELV